MLHIYCGLYSTQYVSYTVVVMMAQEADDRNRVSQLFSSTLIDMISRISVWYTGENCLLPRGLSSSPSSDFDKTVFMLWESVEPSEFEFLCRYFILFININVSAITSHLITMCNTVVMGTNRDEMVHYVYTLATFLFDHEKRISSLYCREGYVPGLQLQGFVGTKSVQDFPLVQNEFPTSIIGMISVRNPIMFRFGLA